MYGTLISSVTVGAGGASTIDFTSIPGTYTDLCLVVSIRLDAADTFNTTALRVNGSSTGYTYRSLYGNGATAASSTDSGATFMGNYKTFPGNNDTANTYNNVIFTIPNYAGSTNKTFSIDGVGETNATTAWQTLTAGVWANTAAITQLTLINIGANYKQYSTAYLYGLTKGSGGASVA